MDQLCWWDPNNTVVQWISPFVTGGKSPARGWSRASAIDSMGKFCSGILSGSSSRSLIKMRCTLANFLRKTSQFFLPVLCLCSWYHKKITFLMHSVSHNQPFCAYTHFLLFLSRPKSVCAAQNCLNARQCVGHKQHRAIACSTWYQPPAENTETEMWYSPVYCLILLLISFVICVGQKFSSIYTYVVTALRFDSILISCIWLLFWLFVLASNINVPVFWLVC